MNNSKNNVCPKCGAMLQENASFCLHCMTPLIQKQDIQKPKAPLSSKRKIIYIIVSIVLALAIISASVFGISTAVEHSPICTFETFQEAVPIASKKMGIDEIWNAKGLIDIAEFESDDVIQYTTDVNLNGAYLSVFFYNEGEEIYAYLCDVQEEDVGSAKEILKCVAQSACNYYFIDIDEVFDNEKLYPRKELDSPFEDYFTDFLSRTEDYNNAIKNGDEISTEYIPMTDDNNVITFYVTERNSKSDTIYDLAVTVQKD